MYNFKFQHLLFGALSITILLSGCKQNTMQSKWNDGNIFIDGRYSDWQPGLTFNEKSNIGIGFANDSSNLYICLTSSDQQLMRQVVFRGFILDIDIPGAKRRQFGINYPTGVSDFEFSQFGRNQQTKRMPGFDQDTRLRFDDIHTEFILIGPGKEDRQIVPLENDYGVEIKISRTRRQLVYETKIPFKLMKDYWQTDKFNLQSDLIVTFKTAELDIAAMRSRTDMGGIPGGRTGGMTGGGRGGQRGGMRGGGRPGGQGMQRPLLECFEFRTKVALARSE
ncbi:MAG: hypothetical protein KAU06_08805 [Candidatus Marinimicrobia bacterium]|nr:hypothetical protein [Candidatus Neomarinimicrobiota bacterium]